MRKIKIKKKVLTLSDIFKAKERARKKEAGRRFKDKIEDLKEMIRVNEELKRIRQRNQRKSRAYS